MHIEFRAAGFQELLTSPAVKALVKKEADRVAATANLSPSTTAPANVGPYYEVEDGSDAKRARYRVHPTSARAAKHEAKTQALHKAL